MRFLLGVMEGLPAVSSSATPSARCRWRRWRSASWSSPPACWPAWAWAPRWAPWCGVARFLASFALTMPTASGSVIVTDTTAGKWYLYGGAASAGLGVVLTFVLSRRRGRWPRRVGAWPR